MFTDMVGFSALAHADEPAALADVAEQNALLRGIFPRHHGREVKAVGDGFLVEFESALDAVRCALEIQQGLQDRNAATPVRRPILVRIGIHVGDVESGDGDVLGDAVNLASRLEPLALPGGICLSQQVLDQVQNRLDLHLTALPSTPLKNLRDPPRLYSVLPSSGAGRRPAGRSAPPEGRSLAVLPLVNISPDAGDEYIADGLTEEIISTLSQVPSLSVIARSSVMGYKSSPKSVSQVGAELGVETVLEGSVRKVGQRLRIALQLIDAPSQRHMWATTYNREVGDVFAVQTDIAERTAEALRIRLGAAPEAQERPPLTDPRAYDLYLRGLVAAAEPGAEGFERAVGSFERATTLDPTFAEAYAAWAQVYVVLAGEYLAVRAVLPKAKELARKALELNPQSSDAHAALGNIALQFDHDWALAEAEFRTALSQNPSNVTALRFYSMLLRSLGRFDEARDTVRRALRLDPAGSLEGSLAWIEQDAGDNEAAIDYAERIRDRHPESVRAHVYLGLTYLTAGRVEEALREAKTPVEGASGTERFDHALLNALLGRPEAARQIVAEVERGEAKVYTSACDLAMLYAALGDSDRAIARLEKDWREGDQMLWNYYRGVVFDPLRGDARFQELVARFGLPEFPIRRGVRPTSR